MSDDHLDPKAILRNNAGALVSRRCRATGTTVTLYDGESAGLDTSGGRYTTACENHGQTCAHASRALATSALAEPFGWCTECSDERSKRQALKLTKATTPRALQPWERPFRACPTCHAFALCLLPFELIAVQPDGTNVVCHPVLGGCNRGFELELYAVALGKRERESDG